MCASMCEYKRGLLTSLLGAREVNEVRLTGKFRQQFIVGVKVHSS
jgi:hypothetical protein